MQTGTLPRRGRSRRPPAHGVGALSESGSGRPRSSLNISCQKKNAKTWRVLEDLIFLVSEQTCTINHKMDQGL